MSREDLRIKLLRIVTGQIKSYIQDHPDHFAPYALATAPQSIAKRVAHELFAKGVTFDKSLIDLARRATEASPPTGGRYTSSPPRPFAIEHKKRRFSRRH